MEHFDPVPEANGEQSEVPEEESGSASPYSIHQVGDAQQPEGGEDAGSLTIASPEASLPPEAQGEANGGPLGCCLGVTVGLFLSLIIGVVSRLYADPLAHVFQGNLSLISRIVMAVLALVGAIICGYFGWKIGRRLYREYEPPVIKERRRKPKAAKHA